MEGPQQPQKKLRLLVLDGGGMRGLATVQILKRLQHTVGLNVNDFDMIGGTSAGGLIALATLLGLNFDQIEALFLHIGNTVFTSTWTNTARFYAGTGASVILGKKAGGKYSTNAYEGCLFEALQQFGDPKRTLAELGQDKTTAVFATAADVSFDSSIRPFIMRSYEHSYYDTEKTMYEAVPDGTSEIPLVQAALATSAAPTYFDSHIIWEDPTNHVKTRLVDGGLGFNNPIFLGVHELKRKFGWNSEVELIVSIGTGRPAMKLAEQDKSVLGWGTTVVNIATEGDFIHNNFQLMRPLLAGFADSVYARFNPEDLGGQPMDDPSEKALERIRQLAAEHMKSKQAQVKVKEISYLLDQYRQQKSD